MDVEIFFLEASHFLQKLKIQLDSLDIHIKPHWSIDHLCYRVATQDRYHEMRAVLAEVAHPLAESEVNGRLITTFKLAEPIRFDLWSIDLVELPAPKPDKPMIEGFEHIEIVCDLTFDEIRMLYRQHLPQKPGENKVINAELQLNFTDLAIKFHHLSLESVICLEENKKVFSAIENLQVLTRLKEFSPIIVGTFPLGISNKNSDVDILLWAPNLEFLMTELQSEYSRFGGFNSYKSFSGSIPYCVVRFEFDGVPFELYGEATPTLRQRAYRHFQVEERILKLGGEPLKTKIMKLRSSGLKTEPAFASVLQLQGDPYDALLELHSWPENELAQLVRNSRQT